jgi:hypothetical protein
LPAKVKDEHHVEVNQVDAERQPTQRREERPRQKLIDDS